MPSSEARGCCSRDLQVSKTLRQTFVRIEVIPGKLCPVHACALFVSTPVLIRAQLGSAGVQQNAENEEKRGRAPPLGCGCPCARQEVRGHLEGALLGQGHGDGHLYFPKLPRKPLRDRRKPPNDHPRRGRVVPQGNSDVVGGPTKCLEPKRASSEPVSVHFGFFGRIAAHFWSILDLENEP